MFGWPSPPFPCPGRIMRRILVIDDDIELCELVAEYLGAEGFDVEAVHDGEAGLRSAQRGDYSLVLLDVMLPGDNGFEILRRLRRGSQLPVVMLTAKGDDIDRIVGLEIGADDYLAKPFNPRELVARIRAVLRRSESALASTPERIEVGDVEVDTGARTVTRGDEEIRLTAVEFDVLERLLRAAGTVVSREDLMRDVLGREYSSIDRSIDMHVSNIRRKLGAEVDGLERIKTVRGVGYIYTRPAAQRSEAKGASR